MFLKILGEDEGKSCIAEIEIENEMVNIIQPSIENKTTPGNINRVENLIKLISDTNSVIYMIIRRFVSLFCFFKVKKSEVDDHIINHLWMVFGSK